MELTLDDARRDQDAVRAWLLEQGLEPNRTMPGVVVEGGRVKATLYVLDRQGRKFMDRDPYTDTPTGAKVVHVNVPLRTPIPPGLGTVIA